MATAKEVRFLEASVLSIWEAVKPEICADEGVIAPRERVIAGVEVAVATEPETPLAVVTETEVTVPGTAATAESKFEKLVLIVVLEVEPLSEAPNAVDGIV